MDVNQIIKQLRLMNSYSQTFIAQKLGITQSSYAKIENNKVDITISKVQSIGEIYSMTVIELL